MGREGRNGGLRLGMRLDPAVAWFVEPPSLNPAWDRVQAAFVEMLGLCAKSGMEPTALQQASTYMLAAMAWARTGLDARMTPEGFVRARAASMLQMAAGFVGGEFGVLGHLLWGDIQGAVAGAVGSLEQPGLRHAAALRAYVAMFKTTLDVLQDGECQAANKAAASPAGDITHDSPAGKAYNRLVSDKLHRAMVFRMAEQGWGLTAEEDGRGEGQDGGGREDAAGEAPAGEGGEAETRPPT